MDMLICICLHYTWYKFFGKIEQFFEKGVNLVSILGKMTIGLRTILVVNSEKNDN